MTTKKGLFVYCFLLFFSFICVAEEKISHIISPISGTWANPQPLIIQVPDNCEVYYSLNGTDPLTSGFAYDNPIVLTETGTQIIVVSFINSTGDVITESVEWTVTESDYLDFIPSTDAPYILFNKDSSIKVPEDISWFIGNRDLTKNEIDGISKGGLIALSENPDNLRYIPISFISNNNVYRYIFRIGDSNRFNFASPLPIETDIVFTDWNEILLANGEKVSFSFDNGPWNETKSKIIIDRTKSHTISWKTETSPIKTVSIPAKPSFQGIPEKGYTNESVKLSIQDDNFIMAYTSLDGNTTYTNTFIVDTISGDSFGFAEVFPIYYDGIYQGDLPIAFFIDKQPPELPEFISSTSDLFSRNEVELKFKSNSTVYYSIPTPYSEASGFSLDNISDYKQNVPEIDSFIKLQQNSIVLNPSDSEALFYTVFAYAEDQAGNKSNITQYSVLIDSINYYLDSSLENNGIGTIEAPYNSFDSIVKTINNNSFTRVMLKGTYSNISSFNIFSSCEFIGDTNVRIKLASDETLTINNANVVFKSCTLEKNVIPTGDMFQKNLVTIENGNFIADDCLFIANFDVSGTGIVARNSSVNLKNSSITVNALSYAALISSVNSSINLDYVRGIATARTAVGLSATNKTCLVSNTQFRIIGAYGRAAELTGISYSFNLCNFISQNAISQKPAIWVDSNSKQISLESDTFSGFSSFIVKESR